MELILASGSPRRRELLSLIGLSFTVKKQEMEEVIEENAAPEEAASCLAYQKALLIAEKYPNAYVIGADTVVAAEGKILGKPISTEEAFEMLSMLSGKSHEVITGVSICFNGKNKTFYEKTEVDFWPLAEEEIRRYIATGEPMDKAGAYGIQGKGSLLVKEIRGDYFAVVGLPLARTVRELKAMGFPME
ncbi:Maf family protein [Metabacillus sp. GX 13764]|uniref:Maf family protein n=1 Tax=Metabacillus kandeliae TaxID=2900151 RepID=UPI001E64CC0D|nr:Maf family protein [Metabacillus kandeliae]MCD7032921.1 Maf family protein [Metabacillus kandeliae]